MRAQELIKKKKALLSESIAEHQHSTQPAVIKSEELESIPKPTAEETKPAELENKKITRWNKNNPGMLNEIANMNGGLGHEAAQLLKIQTNSKPKTTRKDLEDKEDGKKA